MGAGFEPPEIAGERTEFGAQGLGAPREAWVGQMGHLALDLGSWVTEDKDRCFLMCMGHLVTRY